MPHVLHVLPPDAVLSCPGLESWIDAGSGFIPLVAPRGDAVPWQGLGQVAAPTPASRWERLLRCFLRQPLRGNGWAEVFAREGVGLLHLHTLDRIDELLAAARGAGIPVVLSWPRGGVERVDFSAFAQVLVPTPLVAACLSEAGCPGDRLRIAPPPMVAARVRSYARLPKEQPCRWITAAGRTDTPDLMLALSAFAAYRELEPQARLTVVTAEPLGEEAQRLARMLEVTAAIAPNLNAFRQLLAEAHFGLFPLAPTHTELDAGMTWPAWMAAAAGLPCVMGTEATRNGMLDHQQVLIARPEVEELAARMQFLSARPYIWGLLGESAATHATSQLSFERACRIPFEVYRQLLADSVARPQRAGLLSRG